MLLLIHKELLSQSKYLLLMLLGFVLISASCMLFLLKAQRLLPDLQVLSMCCLGLLLYLGIMVLSSKAFAARDLA